jgi:hypothetical protein
MGRLRTSLLAAAMLVAWPAAAAAFPTSGVVTTTQFGTAKPGMTQAQVIAAWGQPTAISVEPSGYTRTLRYGRGGGRVLLGFYNRGRGFRFDSATTRLRGFKVRGVGVGSTWAAVQAALPGADCNWSNTDAFSLGCLLAPRNPNGHRLYLTGQKNGRVQTIHFVSNFVS